MSTRKGRSNVGKSSLLNVLSSSGLAQVDDYPGVTQSFFFYDIERSNIRFVDMPGYGFAHASAEAKGRWQEMVQRRNAHSAHHQFTIPVVANPLFLQTSQC